jgi:hypothetical protein
MTRVQRNVLRKKRTLEHAEPIGNEIQATCVASKRAACALLRGLFSSVLRASVVWALAPVALVMCTVKAETLPPQPQVEVVAVEPMSSRPILPETPIGEISLGAELRVIATPGEFEPASFVIRSSTAVQVQSVRLDPWLDSSDKGGAIASRVRLVKRWYQAPGAWKLHYKPKLQHDPVLVPELLLNDDALVKVDENEQRNYLRVHQGGGYRYLDVSRDEALERQLAPSLSEMDVRDTDTLQPFSIAANVNQQFWISLHVPEVTAPGVYSSRVVIKTSRGERGLPIQLEVLPIRLVPSPIKHTLYYRGVIDREGNGSISSELKSPEQLRAELRNMAEHGVEAVTLYQQCSARAADSPFALASRLRLCADQLDMRKAAGLSNDPLYYLGAPVDPYLDARGVSDLEARVRKMRDWLAVHGINHLYVYGKDEAQGEELARQLRVWRRLRHAGARIMAAGYAEHIDEAGRETDLLIIQTTPTADEFSRMRSYGNSIFKYSKPQTGPGNPVLFRVQRGIALWRAGFDGAMDYAYQHSMGFIWNDFDHKIYRDHVFAYPTSNGVVETLAWEGYREGVDDLRYLATLEDLLAGRPNLPAALAARQFLTDLKQSVDVIPQAARRSMVTHIRALQGDGS